MLPPRDCIDLIHSGAAGERAGGRVNARNPWQFGLEDLGTMVLGCTRVPVDTVAAVGLLAGERTEPLAVWSARVLRF